MFRKPLLLLTLLLLLGACAPDPPPPSEPDPDATLRLAHNFILTRFDPHRATSSYDNTWLYPVYDRLVHVDPEGNAVPGLATAWQFAEDGSHLDLELREGVRFHDGEVFDAAAVAANIERVKTVRGGSVASELAKVDRAEALHSHRVRLHLHKADAALPLILSDRAGMMVSPAAFDERGLDRHPVGAGPFRLLEYRSGHRALFERVEGYWDPEAQGVRRIDMRYMPDEITRLNALRSGQVDMATLVAQQVDEARLWGLNVVTRVGLEFTWIQLNRNRSHFGDVRVRQALNHAVRRAALVNALAMGYGEPSSQLFPRGYHAHDPETGTDHYAHDPERARALLADAGLAEGFEFELIVPAAPAFGPLFEALQAQFLAIGVHARPNVMEGTQISERFYAREEGDAALVSWGGRPDPSQTIDLLFTPGGLPNPGGHTTEAVARLAAAARAEIDPARREVLLRQASAAITEDALPVILWLSSATFAASDRVEGLEVWSSGNKAEFRNIRMLR